MPGAHDLIIVRDKETLINSILLNPEYESLKEDSIIIQEYILHHQETLIKLYAIGEGEFDVVLKKSFSQAAVQDALEKIGYLSINRHLLKLDNIDEYNFGDNFLELDDFQKPDKDNITPMDQFNHIAKVISDKMHIYLHGIDLVRDERNGQYYFFDCNYFSSYNNTDFDSKYGESIV